MKIDTCEYYFKAMSAKVFKVVKAPSTSEVVKTGDNCGPIFMKYIFENRKNVICELENRTNYNF